MALRATKPDAARLPPCDRLYATSAGTRKSTSVPAPGLLHTSRCAPSFFARSRMPSEAEVPGPAAGIEHGGADAPSIVADPDVQGRVAVADFGFDVARIARAGTHCSAPRGRSGILPRARSDAGRGSLPRRSRGTVRRAVARTARPRPRAPSRGRRHRWPPDASPSPCRDSLPAACRRDRATAPSVAAPARSAECDRLAAWNRQISPCIPCSSVSCSSRAIRSRSARRASRRPRTCAATCRTRTLYKTVSTPRHASAHSA